MTPADHPTLIVDGSPTDWLAVPECPYDTVRIDGDLPTVWEACPKCVTAPHTFPRLLRVGDKVTLTTLRIIVPSEPLSITEEVPFATAAVSRIEVHSDERWVRYWLVTVTDVEALT